MFGAQLCPPILLFCGIFFAVALVDLKFPFETSWKRDKSLMACMIFVFKMHNEVNLLVILSGGDLKKYALKVLSQLFTREERGGGGVLPYMGYIGMCRCEGYGFQAVYSSIGYINQSVWV